MEKVCTSINLSKACRQQEELGEGVRVGARVARRWGGAGVWWG